MDASPTVVANDAILAGKEELKKSSERIAAVLIEQLKDDPHFAEFKISVNCRIWKPGNNESLLIAEASSLETFTVFDEREPSALRE